MSKVGNVIFQSTDFAEGVIRTRSIKLNIRLYAIKGKKQSDDHPDFEVREVLPDGDEVHIGNGWKKTAQSGPNIGREHISLSLDDLDFKAPIYVALFGVAEGSPEYDIVWNRPRGKIA